MHSLAFVKNDFDRDFHDTALYCTISQNQRTSPSPKRQGCQSITVIAEKLEKIHVSLKRESEYLRNGFIRKWRHEGRLFQKLLYLYKLHLCIIEHRASACKVRQACVLEVRVNEHCGIGMHAPAPSLIAFYGFAVNFNIP